MSALGLILSLALGAFFVVLVAVALRAICRPQPEGKRLTVIVDGARHTHV